MKRISPNRCFCAAIFCAFFEFLKCVLIQNSREKIFLFTVDKIPKGVRHKPFCKEIVCDFSCLDIKISETILCRLKYEERSKKLFVAFSLKSQESLLFALRVLKNASAALCTSFLNELVQRLMEAFLPKGEPVFFDFDFYFAPFVKPDLKYLNPFKKSKTLCLDPALLDDVLCILYNVYIFRADYFSFVKISADDILFLRGVKKYSKHYKNEDRKRVSKALEVLCMLNLISIRKIKKYHWQFCFLSSRVKAGYIIPKELFYLNCKKYFEKYLAHLICLQSDKSKNFVKLKHPVEFLCKNVKNPKPSFIRERVEGAFDEMVKSGLIKNWEYKKIDENVLCGADWILKYKKLKIIFALKKPRVKFKNSTRGLKK